MPVVSETPPSITDLVNEFESRFNLYIARRGTRFAQKEDLELLKKLGPTVDALLLREFVNTIYNLPLADDLKQRSEFYQELKTLPTPQPRARPPRIVFSQAPNPLYTIQGLPILQRFWFHQQQDEADLAYICRCEQAIHRGCLNPKTAIKFYITGFKQRQIAANLFACEPRQLCEVKSLYLDLSFYKKKIGETQVLSCIVHRKSRARVNELVKEFESLVGELSEAGREKRYRIIGWYNRSNKEQKTNYLKFWWNSAFIKPERHPGHPEGTPELRSSLWDPPLEIPSLSVELQDYVPG